MPSWRTGPSQGPERSTTRRGGVPRSRKLTLAAGAGVALVGTVVGVAAAGVTSAADTKPHAPSHRHANSVSTASPVRHPSRSTGPGPGTADASATRQAGKNHPAGGPPRGAHATPAARTAALRTSCTSVAHVGDSTSVDLISPAFIPIPTQRLAARYSDVGVRTLRVDASGGRSIVEALPGQVNGYNVASAWRSGGFRGCWVFALGTNDAADVAAGSAVGLTARIDEMMSVAHGEPVMWVNTETLLPSGYYANANEQAWDTALVNASHRYPNMRIFDWAAAAQPGWFLSDGIHYNSLGCVMRAEAIADALAQAFPLNGHSNGQIVR